MEITIFVGLSLLLLIAVVGAILRKRKSIPSEPVALIQTQKSDVLEIEPPAPRVPDRVVIGSNPASPLVTIEAVSGVNDFERAKPLDTKSDKSISRLSVLCQAVPSLLVAGEASGKRLMEVVINGDLVRAADGNGLRAFAMNGKSIAEQARLFEVGNLQNMINAAAIWQIASVVVAQKHLADISRKLDEIKAGVQHISQFLENQRKSRMLATYDYLGQVYLSIKGGDLPNSSRINLENCERDLLEIQHHLEMEYRQKIDKKVEHTETFGTEELTNDIGKKISELEELTGDIALCLKTRIAAWHVLSLFPGDPQLKVARRASIQKSIDLFSDLAPHLEESLKTEIAAVDSFWNKGSTLDTRKCNLKSKCMTAAGNLESTARQSSEHVIQSEHILLEHDQPTRLYLQFENGELIGARQAA